MLQEGRSCENRIKAQNVLLQDRESKRIHRDAQQADVSKRNCGHFELRISGRQRVTSNL